jgi:sorbitol-specific phosphotransferase system component IIBC
LFSRNCSISEKVMGVPGFLKSTFYYSESGVSNWCPQRACPLSGKVIGILLFSRACSVPGKLMGATGVLKEHVLFQAK